MRAVSLLFRVTTIVILLQLLLGGLLTFNFITPSIHIVLGMVVFIIAIATMIVTIVTKQRTRSLLLASIILILLIILQIALGFDTLRTGSQLVAWMHFANAMAIYGVAISGSFLSSKITQPDKAVLNEVR